MSIKSITVTKKEELEKAKKEKYDEIIVHGDLADKLKKAKKIAFASKITLCVIASAIGTSIATAPITGGLSMAALAPLAAVTGLEIAAIIAATSIGLALLVAVFKGYDEISYKEGCLVLRKK